MDDLIEELVLRYVQPSVVRTRQSHGEDVANDAIPGRQDRQISNTVQGLALIAAYEAALEVASEVRLEPVLQRIVDLSRTVVPAKYAALGVAGEDSSIDRLLVSGMSAEDVAKLGPIPQGHGLLGVLMDEDKPLMVRDIAQDPRAVGFPEHHPRMRALVGVPIRFNRQALGNIYLADPDGGGHFTDDDVVALRILADHAAAAIDRARLYRTVERGQQQAEEQLSRLRDILNTLPAGVLVMGAPDAHVELANSAALAMIFSEVAESGLLPEVGRDFSWQDNEGSPLPRTMHPGVRALRGEKLGNRQLMLSTSRQESIPVLVQAAPLRSGEGAIVGSVVVCQDFSRIRAAEQIKDDFLSLISHEFRTPLTAIHGGAHLLLGQGDALDSETRQELLEDIVVESGRLDRMLSNLLRVSEIMAGRFQADSEPMLIAPLVQSVIDDFQGRTPGFDFRLDVPSGVPLAAGDPELLKQILRNLYENGVKYSPHGGTISTSARHDSEWVSILVQDEGLGIAADHVASVFERFRRPGADPTVRGMGLGLYLSRLLAVAQGGRIHATSPGPGKGSTFIIDLPIEREWSRDSGNPGSKQ